VKGLREEIVFKLSLASTSKWCETIGYTKTNVPTSSPLR